MTSGRFALFSGPVRVYPSGGYAVDEHPAALLFFGLCPAIAVAVRVSDALWMSAGVILVLVLSNVALSLLARDGVGAGGTVDGPGGEAPGPSAAPAVLLRALVITSILTAAFESLLLVRAPGASASLGIYAPLIAVNCLVLGLGAPGASRYGLGASAAAALGRGLAFALALVLIALVRESLGAGTITLFPLGAFGGTIEIHGLVEQPVRALGFAGGGLLALGYLAGAARAVAARAAGRAAARRARGESTR